MSERSDRRDHARDDIGQLVLGKRESLLVHKSEVNSVERVPCLVDTLASMPLAHKIQVGGLL